MHLKHPQTLRKWKKTAAVAIVAVCVGMFWQGGAQRGQRALAGQLQGEDFGTVWVTAVRSVYDGDTFRADLAGEPGAAPWEGSQPWPAIIGDNMPVRLAGIDTPEIKGECRAEEVLALKARGFTMDRLRSGRIIELRNVQRGKYFRLIAEVWIDGVPLGPQLIQAGLARTYDGGKRESWCAPALGPTGR